MREVNTLQECLNRRAYKQALIHLWKIANTDDPDGGSHFSAHMKRNFDAARHALLVEELDIWLDAGCPSPRDFDEPADLLALVSVLDQMLAAQIADAAFTVFHQPIQSPNGAESFWLLPRRQRVGRGFLYKTPPDHLDFFHPNHIVVPVQACQNKTVIPIRVAEQKPPSAWPDKLRIAIAAFDDAIVLHHIDQGAGVYFTDTEDEAARLLAAKALVTRAEQAQTHILLFPELTLSPKNQAALVEELEHRRRAGNPSSLLLIGLGSFHETIPPASGRRRNRARLVSGRDGRPLLFQDKFQTARDANVIEDFHPAAEVNALLLPIGLLAIAICKDLFDSRSAWLWTQLMPEWLLTPSMSDKLEPHKAKTVELWNQHCCITLVANQPYSPGKTDSRGYIQCERQPQEASSDLHFVEIPPETPHTEPPRGKPALRIVQ